MSAFTSSLKDLKDYALIEEHINNKHKPIQISGCTQGQICHMISSLGDGFKYKIIITFDEKKAKEMYENYKLFDKKVLYYPAKDMIFFSADIHGNFTLNERLNVIKKVASEEELTVIMTIDGLMDKISPLKDFKNAVIKFDLETEIDLEETIENLVKAGYERVSQVSAKGEFSVRGSIIDIYSMTEEQPFRVDLWDTQVDSIKSFDVSSQRSIEPMDSITIYPATEYVLTEDEINDGIENIKKDSKKLYDTYRKKMETEKAHKIKSAVDEFLNLLEISKDNAPIDSYLPYFKKNTVSFLDYFSVEEALIFVDEPSRVTERCELLEYEFRESMTNRLEKGYILPEQANLIYESKVIFDILNNRKSIMFTMLEQRIKHFDIEDNYYIEVRNIASYNGSFDLLLQDLNKYKKNNYKVIIVTASRTRAERLAKELLTEHNLNAYYSEDLDKEIQAKEVMVTSGYLNKGFEYPYIKLAIISETDIFGKEKKKTKKKKYTGEKIQNFAELGIGDYVVHENHGLGIYRGIEKIEVDKVVKDYIKIEYAAKGNLYILATQLDLIQKYASSEAKAPKLNHLGTKEWQKTKARVKGAVKDIAVDLVELYAKRQQKHGFVYGKDTVWQKEFEEMFPYAETEDQLTAIEDTKKDMESQRIMDRLICGDVGYGKTEIAIRAAFKAVQEGKQVAFLVPTTILAQQHYNNFVQRMKEFPLSIELMSRFRTPLMQKNTIEGLKKGFVDIVIGTHRLLSKDIKFKDLGLLIIDEEQRFGVTHKEKIKQIKENVDVLTLTATPIPRTLHMSLIGIRDMSVLEEPPVDRQPIQTYVMEHNEELIREAINRECKRGGQVYYVYNRVSNIEEITNKLAALMPDLNVVYAHGQMSERKLEKIMYDFINGEIDVLVSTTIIETGLDISNVNTIIIHDADKFGLSQLYQLRGRVGRSNRTSYAFLMYKRDKVLKEVAEKRLQAIKEFTELGAGFKIAMRDLEIRGAGNILGAEQHGHMEAVGYDLYCKMLNEAVELLKGNKKAEDDYETNVDLDIDAFIPPSYIKNEIQKLNIYKRIAGIETDEEYEDMLDELIDRFGDLPRSVSNLLDIAIIKTKAHKVYITEVSGGKNMIKLKLYNNAKIDISKIQEFVTKYNGEVKFITDKTPYFTYSKRSGFKNVSDYKKNLLDIFEDIDNSLIIKDEVIENE